MLVSAGWSSNPPVEWVTVPELYNPAQNTWTRLFSADRAADAQALYTFMFVLPDGNLVDAGPFTSRILLTSTWTWAGVIGDPTWPQPQPPATWYEGSAVMYEPGKIMRCGGRARPPNPPYPAVDTTWVVDLSNADPLDPPDWLVAGAMCSSRAHHNLVVLPDGKILGVGRSSGDGCPSAAGIGRARKRTLIPLLLAPPVAETCMAREAVSGRAANESFLPADATEGA